MTASVTPVNTVKRVGQQAKENFQEREHVKQIACSLSLLGK